MNTRSNLVFLMGCLVLPATAQDPIDPSAQAGGDAAEATHGLCVSEGQWVGLGPGYRVDFVEDDCRFLPALGRRAPRSRPLSLRTVAIGRSEATPRTGWLAREPRTRTGNTLSRRLTEDIIERVEMRAEGAELSYVFSRRPPGHGDLVVEVHVDTDLPLQGRGPAGELHFVDPAVGGVAIGSVVGFDAAGRRTAGSTEYGESRITWRLPAEFVERARYPLVLDPIVTRELTQSGDDARAPDVARTDARTLRTETVLVWSEEFSATHSEIRARSGTQPLVVRGSSNQFAVEPKVAYVRGAGTMLVAWQEGPTPFGPWDVRCATLSTVTDSASPPQLLARRAAGFPGVDVGGERTTSRDTGIVVWAETGVGVRAAQVRPQTITSIPAVVRTTTVAADSTSVRRTMPSISRCGGNGGFSMVAWRDDPLPSGTGAIRATVVDRNGAPLGSAFQVEVGGFDPDVDGNGAEFVIGWERPTSATQGPRDVAFRMLRWNGSSLQDRGLIRDVGGQSGLDEREAAVGYEPEGFVIAWTRDVAGTFLDREVAATVLRADLCVRCRHVQLLEDHGRDASPVVFPTWCSGVSRSGSSFDLIVHAVQELSPPFRGSIRAGTFSFRGSSGHTQLYGSLDSLGNGGVMLPGGDTIWPGSATGLVIGSSGATFGLARSRPNQPAVLRLGFGVARVAPCNFLGPVILLGDVESPPILTSGSGSASLSVPIPCDPQLLTTSVFAQWVTLSPGNPLACMTPGLGGLEIATSTMVEYRIGG